MIFDKMIDPKYHYLIRYMGENQYRLLRTLLKFDRGRNGMRVTSIVRKAYKGRVPGHWYSKYYARETDYTSIDKLVYKGIVSKLFSPGGKKAKGVMISHEVSLDLLDLVFAIKDTNIMKYVNDLDGNAYKF